MAGGLSDVIAAALPELTANQTIFDRVAGDIGRLGLFDTSSFKGDDDGWRFNASATHHRIREIISRLHKRAG